MKTAITELLGIDHPIILAAMAWVTDAKMVAAISEGGGLGTLGPAAGVRFATKDVKETGEQLRRQIKEVRTLTDRPFAVNFVVGAAGLDKAFSERCIEVGLEEQVPIAIVSQGSPVVHTERLKKAGLKVIHVCAAVKHARKAEQAGADVIVASGTDGGGHSGFDQNTTFCLVPQAVDAVKIPVIAGGGVADGRQLFAALALGAEAVYVGTRFIATEECPAHDTFKRSILEGKDGDTIAIRHGMVAKHGSGNRGFNAERRGSLRLIVSDRIRNLMVEHAGMLTYDLLMKSYASPDEAVGSTTGASAVHGDTDSGFFAGGQGIGLINEILPCKDVIQQLMREVQEASGRLTV